MFRLKAPESETVNRALKMAQRVGEQADHITARLQPYARAKSPFSAFAADLYETDQERHIHLGPRDRGSGQ